MYFLNEFKYPHEKSLLISGSGVNLKHCKYTPLKNNPLIRFGMFTRIIEEKGIRYFVEAARKLKLKSNVEFVLAGSLDNSKNNLIFEEQLRSWIDEGVVKYLNEHKALCNINSYLEERYLQRTIQKANLQYVSSVGYTESIKV